MRNFVAAMALAFAGCASSSPIVPMGPDTYMISRHGGFGAHDPGALLADEFQEGSDYCAKQGKQLRVVHTQEIPVGFSPARAELHFMCLTPGDPELQRPKLTQEPNSVIEIRNR